MHSSTWSVFNVAALDSSFAITINNNDSVADDVINCRSRRRWLPRRSSRSSKSSRSISGVSASSVRRPDDVRYRHDPRSISTSGLSSSKQSARNSPKFRSRYVIGPHTEYTISDHPFLDPETGLQALRTLFFLLVVLLLLVLRLFHFTTDRRQTSRTDWRQHYPQSHNVGFSS